MGPLEVLKETLERFEKLNIQYFLVGSLGAMYYSRPRYTNDIDLVVQISASDVQKFEALFDLETFYCPPIEILRDEIMRAGSFNLIHQNSGIKIDIILLNQTEFYQSEFQRRRKVSLLPGLEVHIASPEDIIIKKLDFFREGGSEKHLNDIREILIETPIDEEYLQKWVARFGLTMEWQKAKL